MRVRVERRLPRPGDQLAEARITREVGPQREHVHEAAEEALGLPLGAAGHIRAHDDVVLAAVAVQEGGKGGEQCHEERGPLAPAERSQPLGQLRTEPQALKRSGKGPDGRPRAVGRQLENGQGATEAPAPVREVLGLGGDAQRTALRARHVRALDG